jgi:hypothetical protein
MRDIMNDLKDDTGVNKKQSIEYSLLHTNTKYWAIEDEDRGVREDVYTGQLKLTQARR